MQALSLAEHHQKGKIYRMETLKYILVKNLNLLSKPLLSLGKYMTIYLVSFATDNSSKQLNCINEKILESLISKYESHKYFSQEPGHIYKIHQMS